jgi:hypothetical protein
MTFGLTGLSDMPVGDPGSAPAQPRGELRPDPEPELEIRISATSAHILAGHAVPPSSGRGRRAARRANEVEAQA